MKFLKLFFVVFMLSTIVSSCSDDDSNIPIFDANFIKQTNWAGTMTIVTDGKIDQEYGVNILFITESQGQYEYTSGLYNANKDFRYDLNDKLITIGGNRDEYITGDWILMDIKADKMSFKKGLSKDYSILDLVKVNTNNKRPSNNTVRR